MYRSERRASVRITIELKDEYRARLLEIAARRGEKGFSKIIGEAVELYLQSALADEERRRRVLLLRGALTAKEANRLRNELATLRESWRC
jgi:hypothetical protein